MPFPITCSACGKAFAITDDVFERKVAGRVVTIKCKQCQAGIRVDGTQGKPTVKTDLPSSAPPSDLHPGEVHRVADERPAPPIPPAPKVPEVAQAAAQTSDEVLWAVDYPDGQDRELSEVQIAAELTSGAITEATLVWRDGMDEWKELGQVSELAQHRAKLAPPVSAEAARPVAIPATLKEAPPPAAEQVRQAPQPAEQSTPRAAVVAPKSAPLAAAVPPPAASPLQAPAPPAAPSPSVPKASAPRAVPMPPAAVAPAAAAPPLPPLAAPPPPPSANVLPPQPPAIAAMPLQPDEEATQIFSPTRAASAFTSPLSAPSPFAAPPTPETRPAGGPPLFSTQAHVPAPAPAAVFRTTAPAALPEEWPQPKSKTPLIVGSVVVLAAGILLAVTLTSSMDRTPAAALPIAALPPTPAITRRPQEHTEQPTENTANDSARPVGLGPSGPGATPNAGFAELFAAGARSADGKKGVSVPGAQFDPNLARNALAGVAAEVAACKEKDGPSGAATVVVSFDTSGRVSSSTVSGTPFEGTATGACIAAAMKRVTIPPFSGAPGSVSKTVVIQ